MNNDTAQLENHTPYNDSVICHDYITHDVVHVLLLIYSKGIDIKTVLTCKVFEKYSQIQCCKFW